MCTCVPRVRVNEFESADSKWLEKWDGIKGKSDFVRKRGILSKCKEEVYFVVDVIWWYHLNNVRTKAKYRKWLVALTAHAQEGVRHISKGKKELHLASLKREGKKWANYWLALAYWSLGRGCSVCILLFSVTILLITFLLSC